MELIEFEKLLEQYEQDELTSEIIYDLCVKFKSLPLSERGYYTWENLNERFDNFKSTGENLRCWVKSRQYEDGTIVENPRVLKDGQTPNNLELQEIEDKYNEKIEQLYKAKVKASQIIRERNKMWRTEAEKEDIKNAMVEAINGMPSIKFKPCNKVSGNNEANVLIGDWHIGAKIDNFVNKYNFEIATRRIEKFVEKAINKCKSSGVKKVNIISLGDMIMGYIHTTNRMRNEFDVITQTMKASELLCQLLIKFAENFPEVTYRSVLDNHGRLMKNLDENLEEENASRWIDYYIEARLKNTKIQFMKDNLDDNLIFFKMNNGQKVAATHGHLGSGINNIVQEMWGATREYCDVIYVGHLHQEKEKMYQGTRVIMNNSLMGTDDYARSRCLFGEPSQAVVIYEEDGSFEDYRVVLGDIQ